MNEDQTYANESREPRWQDLADDNLDDLLAEGLQGASQLTSGDPRVLCQHQKAIMEGQQTVIASQRLRIEVLETKLKLIGQLVASYPESECGERIAAVLDPLISGERD